MHQLNLPAHVLSKAEHLAALRGFDTVEDFLTSVVEEEAHAESLDARFTPEVVAYLDQISASIQAGEKTYTPDQVTQFLDANKAAWLKNRPA